MRLRLLALEGDARGEPRLGAQRFEDAAHSVARLHRDERLVRRLDEAHAAAGGQPVVIGDDEPQPLFGEAAHGQFGGVGDG